jgi:hypothetical protein
LQGMDMDLRLAELHREEVRRGVEELRRVESGDARRSAGLIRELRIDGLRLLGAFGIPGRTRKRKGVA